MANFCSCNFAVREAHASLARCIECILRIELKQSYCENLESVPAEVGGEAAQGDWAKGKTADKEELDKQRQVL